MASQSVLLAAVSGRALAQSARRGGYLPLVADFFGDQDTVAAAHAHTLVDGSFARGFREPELMAALERLAAQHPPAGIVCGTGFEDRPQLLAQIERRWRQSLTNPLCQPAHKPIAKQPTPEWRSLFYTSAADRVVGISFRVCLR